MFIVSKFWNLLILAINGCNITSWNDLQKLQNHLPLLEELYAANNNLSDVPTDVKGSEDKFCKLRVLDLSFCNLKSWDQICFFGKFSALTDIILDGNEFREVLPFDSSDFIHLNRISLSNTRFESWSLFDSLNSLPCLHHLRITHIPLFYGKGSSEVRPIIIGRLKSLQFLNGSCISEKERIASERVYLKSIIGELTQPQSIADINELHPRYSELRLLYGFELSNQSQNTVSKLSTNLVVINIHDLCGNNNKGITKSIPKSLAVGKVKFLIKQCFGTDPSNQVLSLRSDSYSIPVLLEDDERTIEYYGAVDDSDIFVNYCG